VRELEPGHTYQLEVYQPHRSSEPARVSPEDSVDRVVFRREVGHGYPGNQGDPRPGTSTQEVMRVAHRRLAYVNRQRDSSHNVAAMQCLRRAIFELEARAAGERGLDYMRAWHADFDAWMGRCDGEADITTVPTCPTCGHIFCRSSHGQDH
jgi:hypothetical protein